MTDFLVFVWGFPFTLEARWRIEQCQDQFKPMWKIHNTNQIQWLFKTERKVSSTDSFLPFDSLVHFREKSQNMKLPEKKTPQTKITTKHLQEELCCKGHCLHMVPFCTLIICCYAGKHMYLNHVNIFGSFAFMWSTRMRPFWRYHAKTYTMYQKHRERHIFWDL